MARSERLLELIQVLRRHRRPVSGQTLAEEFGGPLAFLWDRIVASKLAADCEQQTRAFIVAAERRP